MLRRHIGIVRLFDFPLAAVTQAAALALFVAPCLNLQNHSDSKNNICEIAGKCNVISSKKTEVEET